MNTTELGQVLDRLRAQGKIHAPDPAQVQARTRAYLTARGQAIAHDLDLDQITPEDAAELGRLDVLAEMPDTDQDLAPILAMVADTWHQTLATAQHEIDHRLGQDHDHGRLRETGVDLDQDHDRIQVLGLDPGHRPPEGDGKPPGPTSGAPERERGSGRGRTATASRSSRKNRGDKPPVTDEVAWYLENVPDPDDKEWTP